MRYIALICFLAMLSLQMTLISSDAAVIELDCQQKVASGDAFLARAISREKVCNFSFDWLGRQYVIEPSDENGLWQAEILLPVPLNARAQAHKLALGADLGAGKGVLSTSRTVDIWQKKRPVQKLQVDRKYVNPPDEVQEKIKNDREKVRATLAKKLPRKLWQYPFQRPVQGATTSLFGLKRVFNDQPRGLHRGLDLRAAMGADVHACADGVVELVDNLYYSGNVVYLNHGDGVFSAYLHLSEAKVSLGDKVKKGDVIGLAGATGRVTGPHVHLSTFVQGVSVDPESLLEKRAGEKPKAKVKK